MVDNGCLQILSMYSRCKQFPSNLFIHLQYDNIDVVIIIITWLAVIVRISSVHLVSMEAWLFCEHFLETSCSPPTAALSILHTCRLGAE
jgi:hypothetical protein